MLSIKVGEQIEGAEARDRVRAQIVTGLLTSIQPRTVSAECSRKPPQNSVIAPKAQITKAAAEASAV